MNVWFIVPFLFSFLFLGHKPIRKGNGNCIMYLMLQGLAVTIIKYKFTTTEDHVNSPYSQLVILQSSSLSTTENVYNKSLDTERHMQYMYMMSPSEIASKWNVKFTAEIQELIKSEIKCMQHFDQYRFSESFTDLYMLLYTYKNLLGANHLNILEMRLEMLYALNKFEKYTVALEGAEDLLFDQEQFLGPNHWETLKTVALKSWLFAIVGRRDESLDLHNKLINLRELYLGKDHISSLKWVDQKCFVLEQMGKYQEQLECCNALLKTRRRLQGEDHIDTLITKQAKAQAFRKLGNLREAMKIYLHIETKLSTFREKHHSELEIQNKFNTVEILEIKMKYEEANEICSTILDDAKNLFGSDCSYPLTMNIMEVTAKIQMNLKYYAESKKLFTELYTLRLRRYGESDSRTRYSKDFADNVSLLLEEKTMEDEKYKLSFRKNIWG